VASIILRPNGIYYAVATIKGKRVWRSTGAKTPEEAEVVAHQLFPESLTPRSLGKLSDFIPQYMEYAQANLAPSTVRVYKDATRYFMRLMGDKKLTSYTPVDIERFKILRLKEVSPVRVNMECRHLKAFFQVALRWEKIEENPFTGIKFLKIPPRRPTFFTGEEFQKLLGAIPHQWFRTACPFTLSRGCSGIQIFRSR